MSQILVKTISATYGRKINLGDYNSLELSVTTWADVIPTLDEQGQFIQEQENVANHVNYLVEVAKAEVRNQALELRETILGGRSLPGTSYVKAAALKYLNEFKEKGTLSEGVEVAARSLIEGIAEFAADPDNYAKLEEALYEIISELSQNMRPESTPKPGNVDDARINAAMERTVKFLTESRANKGPVDDFFNPDLDDPLQGASNPNQ